MPTHAGRIVSLTCTHCTPPIIQVGDDVTATLTVDKASGSRVTFRTLCCHSGTGDVLVEGSALALIRPAARPAEAAAEGAAEAAGAAAAAPR